MSAFDWMIQIGYFILVAALICAVARVVIGPTLPDRVIALDLVAMVIAGIAAIYAIDTDNQVYLDVVLVMAITIFFSTVAFSRYLQQREKR
jgi:multicomponent Na+:H+ antiporter subunit F